MGTRLFALFCGIFYLAFGLIGFVPALKWTPDLPRERMWNLHWGAGWVFGTLPVNWPHNIIWIIVGVFGIVCCASFVASRAYCRILFVNTLPLVFVGFMPFGISTLWGYLPMTGWNVIIHAWTAMISWYFGWIYPLGLPRKVAVAPAH